MFEGEGLIFNLDNTFTFPINQILNYHSVVIVAPKKPETLLVLALKLLAQQREAFIIFQCFRGLTKHLDD